MKKTLLTGIAAFTLAACTDTYFPPEQQAFINAVTGYSSAYDQTKSNAFQQEAVWNSFKVQLCRLSPVVTGWVGTVDKVEMANWPENDRATLSIHLNRDVQFHTFSTQFQETLNSDHGKLNQATELPKTLILKTSPLFGAVSQLSKGDRIKFSGYILTNSNSCLSESSMTRQGAVREPEFNFRFDKVERI